MITENGIVVALDPDAIWIETIRKSTCEACSAQKGCGQQLMSSISGRMARIRVLTQYAPQSQYRIGEQVTVGIPDNAVVLGSLLVYSVPLLTMILAAIAAGKLWPGDLVAAISGLAGLVLGGVVVRLLSWRQRNNPDLQPVLLKPVQSVPINPLKVLNDIYR